MGAAVAIFFLVFMIALVLAEVVRTTVRNIQGTYDEAEMSWMMWLFIHMMCALMIIAPIWVFIALVWESFK